MPKDAQSTRNLDGMAFRELAIRAPKEGKPLRAVLTTEQPVEMWDWERNEWIPEVLLMEGMEVPARGQIPLLDCHTRWSVEDQLGSVSDLRTHTASEKTPYDYVDGELRFDSTERSKNAETKVREGHVTDTSVGYAIKETVYVSEGATQTISGKEFTGPVNVRTKWRVNEDSLCPIGADELATVRSFTRSLASSRGWKPNREHSKPESNPDSALAGDRGDGGSGDPARDGASATGHQPKAEDKKMAEDSNTKSAEKAPGITAEQRASIAAEAAKQERSRRTELDNIGDFMETAGVDKREVSEWMRQFHKSNATPEEVNRAMRDHPHFKTPPSDPDPAKAEPLGMNEKEAASYSMVRALSQVASGKSVDGLEREVSDAIAQRCGRDADGFFVPTSEDLRAALPEGARDLTVATATAGGNLVPTDHRDDLFIDFLRPQTLVRELGATVLTGLAPGNVQIPRQTSGATAGWSAETADHSQSEPAFDQLDLQPYELGCYAVFTKKLLAQSSPDIEMLVRQDFNNAVSVAFDNASFQGDGSAKPTGILNVSGVATSTIAAAGNPTWAELVEFEEDVEVANALRGNLAYVVANSVKTWAKTTLKETGVAGYLWESDNTVNSYRAIASTQVPANTILFGDFTSYIQAMWDGVDVTVDPYSLAEGRKVKIVINMMADGNGRRGASFSKNA